MSETSEKFAGTNQKKVTQFDKLVESLEEMNHLHKVHLAAKLFVKELDAGMKPEEVLKEMKQMGN
jgi:hypothetical protein